MLETDCWAIVAAVVEASSSSFHDTCATEQPIRHGNQTAVSRAGGLQVAPPAASVAASATPSTLAKHSSNARTLSPAASPASRKQRSSPDGSPSMARMLSQQFSPRVSASTVAMQYGCARAAMCEGLTGVRWIYECVLDRSDFGRTNTDGGPANAVPI